MDGDASLDGGTASFLEGKLMDLTECLRDSPGFRCAHMLSTCMIYMYVCVYLRYVYVGVLCLCFVRTVYVCVRVCYDTRAFVSV